MVVVAQCAVGFLMFVYRASVEAIVARLPPVPGLIRTVRFVDDTLG